MVTGSVIVCACGRADGIRFAAARELSARTVVGTAPMFAASGNGREAAAWVSAPDGGSDGRLFVSVNGGAATELRDSLGPVEPHGEAPPKLAYAADGSLHAVYVVAKVVPGARFPLAALRFTRSVDGGRTWTAPVTVTDDGDFGEHNFHALHVARDGTIYVTWLGSRRGEGSASRTWVARSVDSGKSWSPAVRVAPGEACPCCRTALATAIDGTVYVAWRSVRPGNVREIVVARSNDRGRTWSPPVRAQADGWVVDGCPHAGPSLQVDAAGRVHVAWWSGKEGVAGVWYARSVDGGRTFTSAVPLDVARLSRPSHVQLASSARDDIVAAWDVGTTTIPTVVVRRSRDAGTTFARAQVLSAEGRAASFPVVAVADSTVTVAWTERPAASAARDAADAPNMKDPHATMGLPSVGDAVVLVRKGVLD